MLFFMDSAHRAEYLFDADVLHAHVVLAGRLAVIKGIDTGTTRKPGP